MRNIGGKGVILVTGGAGYIGSHCVLKLLEQGNNIVIFDSLETGHIETVDTLKNIEGNGKIIDFIKGNLKNYDEISSVFKKHNIDSVMHFAAFSQVGESVKNPQKYYFNNVYGSLNLFKAMIENNVNKIVFSSSAAVYGNPEYTPIDEEHPTNPINPYGETKLIIENILKDYNKYGLKSVCLRYFNASGADSLCRIGEWHEPETHLIPNILKSIFNTNDCFKIFGDDYDTKDGTCIRDYIDIDDLANAHILALKYLADGGDTECFNLGTTNGNSVKEVFDITKSVTGKEIKTEIVSRREGDPAILIADNKKAKKLLNWEPKKTLTESIENAYRWEQKRNKLIS